MIVRRRGDALNGGTGGGKEGEPSPVMGPNNTERGEPFPSASNGVADIKGAPLTPSPDRSRAGRPRVNAEERLPFQSDSSVVVVGVKQDREPHESSSSIPEGRGEHRREDVNGGPPPALVRRESSSLPLLRTTVVVPPLWFAFSGGNGDRVFWFNERRWSPVVASSAMPPFSSLASEYGGEVKRESGGVARRSVMCKEGMVEEEEEKEDRIGRSSAGWASIGVVVGFLWMDASSSSPRCCSVVVVWRPNDEASAKGREGGGGSVEERDPFSFVLRAVVGVDFFRFCGGGGSGEDGCGSRVEDSSAF